MKSANYSLTKRERNEDRVTIVKEWVEKQNDGERKQDWKKRERKSKRGKDRVQNEYKREAISM